MKLRIFISIVLFLLECDTKIDSPIKEDLFNPYKELWETPFGDFSGFSSTFLDYNDNILYYYRFGMLHALECDSGKQIWEVPLSGGGLYLDQIHFIDDVMYFNMNRAVYAMTAKTGNIIWKVDIPYDTSESSFIKDNKLFLGTRNGDLMSFSLSDGTIVDRINFKKYQVFNPNEVAGMEIRSVSYDSSNDLYLVGGSTPYNTNNSLSTPYFFFYHASENVVKHTIIMNAKRNDVTLAFETAPYIYDDIAVIGQANGYIKAINLKTFKELWTAKNDYNYFNPFVGFEGRVIAYGFGLEMICYDIYSGKKYFTYYGGESYLGGATVVDNVLYAVSSYLFSVNIETGKIYWKLEPQTSEGGKFIGQVKSKDGKTFVSTGFSIIASNAAK